MNRLYKCWPWLLPVCIRLGWHRWSHAARSNAGNIQRQSTRRGHLQHSHLGSPRSPRRAAQSRIDLQQPIRKRIGGGRLEPGGFEFHQALQPDVRARWHTISGHLVDQRWLLLGRTATAPGVRSRTAPRARSTRPRLRRSQRSRRTEAQATDPRILSCKARMAALGNTARQATRRFWQAGPLQPCRGC